METHPKHATHLTTYDDFLHEARSWASECREGVADALLVVLGPPGIGKTEAITRALEAEGFERNKEDGYGYFRGVMRGLHLYQNEYRFRHNPIVIDDILGLLEDPNARDILLASTDTGRERQVNWETAHRSIGDDDGQTPSSFVFGGYLAINANGWPKKHNYIMEAILSRATCVAFTPTAEETYRYAKNWFLDGTGQRQEIYDYVASLLDQMSGLDCRILVREAPRLHRRYPDDWRDRLARMLVPADKFPQSVVKRLSADRRHHSDAERRAVFCALTGMSERSYWRMKRELGLSEARTPRVPPQLDGRRCESRRGT